MTDPREIIDTSPMHRFQIWAVAITIGLNALDGFDVLSISFASPGIAKEWGIDRAQLGIVLSMELLGMALGSMLLGGAADKIGRRPMILSCLVTMTTGMFLCTLATGVVALSASRVLTGLGIGGMLAAINAMTAEYSNERRRDIAIAMMGIGYPVGAVIGGSISAMLLQNHDWRSVFLFGALVTSAFIPLVWWRLPESVHFLCQKRPTDALERCNAILARMGHRPATAINAPRATTEGGGSLADILRPGLARITIAVTAAYFLHITTFYFMLKWIPKIVADMGFAPAAAASILVWANVGGAAGGATLGFLAPRFGVLRMTIGVLILSSIMVVLFGRVPVDLGWIALVVAITGFFTNAGIVGLYAIVARSFPTHVRATGTGFVIGIGRGGSALAPVAAGFLFQAGFSLPQVAMAMGAGSVLGAIALTTIGLSARPGSEPLRDGQQ